MAHKKVLTPEDECDTLSKIEVRKAAGHSWYERRDAYSCAGIHPRYVSEDMAISVKRKELRKRAKLLGLDTFP